jgi:protein-S-isoprenylcysteine O-methyltransferase Ste14
MKQKYIIDTFKGVSFLVILLMIAAYDQWDNSTAWVYLGLHGAYGILWVLKSRIFPDKSWEQEVGMVWGVLTAFGLIAYWVAPWMLISRGVECPPWYLGMCVGMNVFGVFLHFVTDMQKFTSLQLQPEKLITTGMMSRVRNLNYFGEFLIYLSLALLALHWVPLVILALFILVYWLPNMRRKDQSLSRYSNFKDYQDRTKFFIPFLL